MTYLETTDSEGGRRAMSSASCWKNKHPEPQTEHVLLTATPLLPGQAGWVFENLSLWTHVKVCSLSCACFPNKVLMGCLIFFCCLFVSSLFLFCVFLPGAPGRRRNKLQGRCTASVGLFTSLPLQPLSLSPAATPRQFQAQRTIAILRATISFAAGGTQTVRDALLMMG